MHRYFVACKRQFMNCNDPTVGWYNKIKPPKAYQEEKHCLVLITHLAFTRDPPQKWFPFLHTRGQRSYRGTAECICTCSWPAQTPLDWPVPEAHCPWRIPGNPIHNPQPGNLEAVLSLPALTKPTGLCFHKRWHIIVKKHTRWIVVNLKMELHINWETNLLVQSWAISLQLFEKQQEADELLNFLSENQNLWMNCHHTVH